MPARRKSTPEEIARSRTRVLEALRSLKAEDIDQLSRSMQERKLAREELRARKKQTLTRH
jgi:hypothetical protein